MHQAAELGPVLERAMASQGRFMAALADCDRTAAALELARLAGYLDIEARGETADLIVIALRQLTTVYHDSAAWAI